MSAYTVAFHWDEDHPVPVLHIIVNGDLPNPFYSLPALINRAHAFVDQYEAYQAVYLAYDLTGTSGKLPLEALMRRGQPSPKVQRVAIIGAGSRSDEMAVLIMASARHIPYEFCFFPSLADASSFLAADYTPYRYYP